MKRGVKLFVIAMVVLLLFAGTAFAGEKLMKQDRLKDGTGINCPSLLSMYLGTTAFDTALSVIEDQYPIKDQLRNKDQLRDCSCLDGDDPIDKPLQDRIRAKDGSCQDVPDDDETIEATVTQSQDRNRTPDKVKDRAWICR